MTELATEPPIATPSRPPPGAFALGPLQPSAQIVVPVGPVGPPAPTPQRRRGLGWRTVAVLTSLASATLTLGFVVLDEPPQAIERASRSAEARTQEHPVEIATAQRWMVPEVTLVIDDSVAKIGPDADQAIVQAFGAWLSNGPDLPELRIDTGSGLKPKLDPDGVNAVMYAPIEFPGHEDDLAITIGFSDEESGEITEADIIINSRHTYGRLSTETPGAPTTSCDGSSHAKTCDYQYDLQNVMTHEAGHFYGLGEDREDRTATMYSCTSACETHKRDPSASDQAAISKLYENGFGEKRALGSCHGAQVAPGSTPWGLAGFLALPLLALVRRRASR